MERRIFHFHEVGEAYKEARKYVEKGKVAPFPPYLTFELVNRCNFRCIMCPAPLLKEKRLEMDFNLFKQAIDEAAVYGSLIRLIGYEEPFLYGKIRAAIKYVKERNLLLHITTNGSLLNEELMEMIVQLQVESIIFSFQGLTEKEYCTMRNTTPDVYSKVISNIKKLHESRRNNKPYIKITATITERDRPQDKDQFIKAHLSYANEVQITGFTHFVHMAHYFGKVNIWRDLHIAKPREKDNVRCFLPNYEMIIKEDGNVYPCCGAFTTDLKIGSIKENTLLEIWNSGLSEEVRTILGKGEVARFKDCYVCPVRYEYEEIGNTVSDTSKGRLEKYCGEP